MATEYKDHEYKTEPIIEDDEKKAQKKTNGTEIPAADIDPATVIAEAPKGATQGEEIVPDTSKAAEQAAADATAKAKAQTEQATESKGAAQGNTDPAQQPGTTPETQGADPQPEDKQPAQASGVDSAALAKGGIDDATRNAILSGYDNEIGSYDTMIEELMKQKQEYAEETSKQQKAMKTSSMWGGITEATAALVNLIGTTKGATPQKWTSPQSAWQTRADAYRKERETRLQSYQKQIADLQKAKGALAAKRKTAETQLAVQDSLNQRNAINNAVRMQLSDDRIQASLSKALANQQVQLARLSESQRKDLFDKGMSFLHDMINSHTKSWGTPPTETTVNNYAQMALEASLSMYKGTKSALPDPAK